MSVSERNPCISTKKEMEPREPVVTYNGEDRSEAAGHGVASERSETRRREPRKGRNPGNRPPKKINANPGGVA